MSSVALTRSNVQIDNTILDIDPTSLKYKFGYGEKEVKTTIGSNGQVTANLIYKPDTQIGTVMFNLINTQRNQEYIDGFFAEDLLNKTVQILDQNGTIVPFTNMAIINEPEYNSDGSGFELSFAGPPVKGQ